MNDLRYNHSMKCFDAKQAQPLNHALRAALHGPLPGAQAQLLMAPAGRSLTPEAGVEPRRAAVLIPIFPQAGTLRLLLTLRSERLHHHKGEVSFPGGQFDCEDEDLSQTALREVEEELGIPRTHFALLGHLTPLYVPPSRTLITPYVGWADEPPEIRPNPDEVARTVEIPLAAFWEPEMRQIVTFTVNGWELRAPAYRYDGVTIWGATAMMLSELLTLLDGLTEGKA